jgi:hypothetical protein
VFPARPPTAVRFRAESCNRITIFIPQSEPFISMITEQELAIRRGHAVFRADVERVVRVIAERHRASHAPLNRQLPREILEETLADIGLAARWPAQLINALSLEATIPPGDNLLTSADAVAAGDFGKLVASVLANANTV